MEERQSNTNKKTAVFHEAILFAVLDIIAGPKRADILRKVESTVLRQLLLSFNFPATKKVPERE